MWSCQSCNASNPDIEMECQTCGVNKTKMKDPHVYANLSVGTPQTVPMDAYIHSNLSARILNIISNVYLVFAVIFGVIWSISVFDMLEVWIGSTLGLLGKLIFTVGILGVSIIPALLLKAVSHIWQNTQDTSKILLYFMEKDRMDARKNKTE